MQPGLDTEEKCEKIESALEEEGDRLSDAGRDLLLLRTERVPRPSPSSSSDSEWYAEEEHMERPGRLDFSGSFGRWSGKPR